jgi:dihydrofolate reductase
MSKLIVWNIMSLDGYFEGREPWDLATHELVWGEELEQFSKDQLREASVILFGRATYEGMAAYWQKAEGEMADGMNTLPKAVVSTTLTHADWRNTRVLRSVGEVMAVKAESASPVYVFGSAKLVAALSEAGLVDEYRVCISPILLGGGSPLFKGGERQKLHLLEARALSNGGVILRYAPA